MIGLNPISGLAKISCSAKECSLLKGRSFYFTLAEDI